MSDNPSDEQVREWNRKLLEILKREHPEMDPDPDNNVPPVLSDAPDTVDAAEILSGRRFQRLVMARHEAFAALVGAGYSLSATGRLMRRDHTTVLYVMRKIREASRAAGVQ